MQSAHMRDGVAHLQFLPCEADVDLSMTEPTAIELSIRYDHLFKEIVSSGWCNESDGNVEAPSGYFSKIEVTQADRKEMREMLEHHDSMDIYNTALFDEIEDGWYLTREDNNDLIWIWFDTRENITRAYQYLVDEYIKWDSDEEESDNG